MELDIDQIDDLLDVLRKHGVTQFSCPAYSLSIGEAPVPESDAPTDRQLIRVRPETYAKGIYANPALWAGGEPPRFPKKES